MGHAADQLGHQAGLLEHQDVDFGDIQGVEVGQGHFGVETQRLRLEATLGQAALQGHLTALEADLVVAARARFLALVATTRGLAQAGADAAADTALGMLGARAGLDAVEFHV